MSKKRVSYQNLLKQAISEFDTSKTVDVKGPMLDPILKWDGDGELPIYKDAASILERYYFNENSDKGVEVVESEYNEDGTEKKTESEKDADGAGTTQAGTSDKATISAAKGEIEDDLALESVVKEQEEEEEKEEDKKEEDKEEKEETMTEDLENQIIEKLIAEMEAEEEEEEVAEMDMTYTGKGPKEEAPKEKKSTDPEEHTTGAGTEQAGTGDDEGQIPDRKDRADQMVKPKNYNEQEEVKDEKEEEEEEELDVDKELKEQTPVPGFKANVKGGDDEELEEAFKIFKEAIEEEEEEKE